MRVIVCVQSCFCGKAGCEVSDTEAEAGFGALKAESRQNPRRSDQKTA